MIVVMIESLGMFLALGEITGRTIDRDALSRGLRADGVDIIDFGMGNPDMPTPKHIVDKLIERSRAMLDAGWAGAASKASAARDGDAAAAAPAPDHNRVPVLLDGELARNLHLALGAALSGATDGTRGRSDGTRR